MLFVDDDGSSNHVEHLADHSDVPGVRPRLKPKNANCAEQSEQGADDHPQLPDIPTPLRGSDHIAGGAGNDEIFGNLDPDTISGGPGNDRINVVRGDIDSVRCGPGHDVVFADAGDKVAGDCEDVRR